MNWRRIEHNDKDPKHYKEWRAERGKYRIVWRNQTFGVSVSSGYQCCMRIFIPETGESMWEFVDRNHHPLYRTLCAAKAACEKHANPNYKPIKKTKRQANKRKRKAPMKVCSQCEVRIHVRRATCDCGYKFPKKEKENDNPTSRTSAC